MVRVCVWVFLAWGAVALTLSGVMYGVSIATDSTTKERLGKKPPGYEQALEESRRALERHGQGRVRRRVLRAGAHASTSAFARDTHAASKKSRERASDPRKRPEGRYPA